MTLQELLANRLSNDHGLLRDTELAELARLDRLRLVLVRCGACRFTCAAQDARHLIDIIRADGRDYVRDISLLASDPARQGDFRPCTNDPPLPQIRIADAGLAVSRRSMAAAVDFGTVGDYGGAFDGFTVTSDANPCL